MITAAKHAKKLMYTGLLLTFAALYFLKPSLTDFEQPVDVKGNADRQIREGNFIASRPAPVQDGDIIIYEMDNLNWVRHLIGMPGEVISVADGGVFINGKPIDTTFLEKGTPILPAYNSYTIPPNQIVVGTAAIEPGVFRLVQIDKPAEIRRGELAFSASEMNRGAFLAVLVGFGYVLLLVFGPLLVERRLDPQERWYRVPKFLWYGLWILIFAAILFPLFGDARDWNFTFWQTVQIALVSLNVRFTALLVYLGASLEQSAIVSLVTGVSGLASAALWLIKKWEEAGRSEAAKDEIKS